MVKRISITPKEGLLKVPQIWRRKFAEAASEVLILEGRYKEMMAIISGLTLADLTGETPDDCSEKKCKPRKYCRNEPIKTVPSIEPVTIKQASYSVTTKQEAKTSNNQIALF